MNWEENYLEPNRKAWNDKVSYHVDSEFYNQAAFLAGENTLNTIELDLLGDLSGKEILHLQCHFGQDTISMARMGARSVGVDFSDKAIAVARQAAESTGANARFVCSDVYQLPEVLEQSFDIVFTSYGTIGWLPDLDKWAAVVARYLKPNGRFVFAEFHPLVWIFDNDFEKVAYRYFKTDAIVENLEGTYADADAPLKNTTVSWNHSLSEVFGSLKKNGLTIEEFREFDYSPYECFPDMKKVGERKFQIEKFGDKLPMVYALSARK